MISCFIPAAFKRLDISAILLSKKERLKILRAAKFLTKVEYLERDGSSYWIAAWFDGGENCFRIQRIDSSVSNC